MKELHNHIFSDTTCISKENMLKYINKQLSREELYEMERHMLDCEFCSEAYEGLAAANDSSALFAIDAEIDKLVSSENNKRPLFRSLMVAASIAALLVGSYLTIHYYQNAISSDNGLALNHEGVIVEKRKEDRTVKDEKLGELSPLELQSEEIGADQNEQEMIEIIEPNKVVQEDKLSNSSIQIMNEMREVSENEVDMAEDEELIIEEAYGEAIPSEEVEEDSYYDRAMKDGISVEDNVDKFDREATMDQTTLSHTGPVKMDSKKIAEKKSRGDSGGKMRKNKPNKNRKTKTKGKIARTINSTESVGNKVFKPEMNNTSRAQKFEETNDIVFDQMEGTEKEREGQIELTDGEKKNGLFGKSMEGQMYSSEFSDEELTQGAMDFYDSGKYENALREFDLVLVKQPGELSALFYKGMCYYHLNRFKDAVDKFSELLSIEEDSEFDEDTKWYRALSLIETKDYELSKKQLEEIIDDKGKYQQQAQEKLEEL